MIIYNAMGSSLQCTYTVHACQACSHMQLFSGTCDLHIRTDYQRLSPTMQTEALASIRLWRAFLLFSVSLSNCWLCVCVLRSICGHQVDTKTWCLVSRVAPNLFGQGSHIWVNFLKSFSKQWLIVWLPPPKCLCSCQSAWCLVSGVTPYLASSICSHDIWVSICHIWTTRITHSYHN